MIENYYKHSKTSQPRRVKNRRRSQLPLLVCVFVILVTLLGNPYLNTRAQNTGRWAPAKPIPLYYDVFPPIMVADKNRTVHAFNSVAIELGVFAINYRTWKPGLGWSPPNDILLPKPSGSVQDVLLDEYGKFHMIFYLGQEENGSIQYTTAWASQASITQAWSEPIEIAADAGPLESANLAGDGKDTMYVVFVGRRDGAGIYEIHSTDGGLSWTQPTALQIVREQARFVTHINLALDSSGNLHAVWAMLEDTGLGNKVYYSHRDVESGEWSNPYLIAAKEGNDYAADWPAIIEYEGELIVMYMDGTIPTGVPPTQWMRRSSDGGNTWSTPVRPFPHVGEYGASQMVVDSAGVLHIILASRVGRPEIGGMWHGVWLGDSWSELELFTPRSAAEAELIGSYSDAGAASIPRAVVSQGNVLLAAWWHNKPEAPPAGYSYLYLDAPELPLETLPMPEFTPTPSITPTPEITLTAPSPSKTPTVVTQNSDSSNPISFGNPGITLLIGALPVILILGLVFLVQRLSSK